MWMGDGNYKLAGSLVTLIHQLEAAYPDREWQTSGGTGTIGDAAHRAEGSASDHNPWLNSTVRALDVAKTANGPDCEALFRMVNKMYGARDPRVFPYGYAIFNGRVTDWGNPGGYHAQQGDQHLTHCHISVGQTGYNATNPWPIPSTDWFDMATEAELRQIVHEEIGKFTQAYDPKTGKWDGQVHNFQTVVVKGLQQFGLDKLSAVVTAIRSKVGA